MSYVPMLAESVVDGQVERLLNDDDWAVEQKLNGMRVVFVVKNGVAKPYNRQGQTFRQHMPRRVIEEMTNSTVFRDNQKWVFDGEVMEDRYVIFDLLATPQGDVTKEPFGWRRQILQEAIFPAWSPDHVVLAPHARTTEAKRKLLETVERIGGEGVMFKRLDAPYATGLRSSAMLKYKLWASADVIVTGPHPEGKRSVEIAAFDGETLTALGTVSVADRWLQRLEAGDVIEVKYLYRGAQGHLYQPAFLRERPDKNPFECGLTQLKPVNKAILTDTMPEEEKENNERH